MNIDLSSLINFKTRFPKSYFIEPSGELPSDSHMLYSFKQAVICWEPDEFCGHDLFKGTDLDLRREDRISKGPKAKGGPRHHGTDFFEAALDGPEKLLKEIYEIERSELRNLMKEYMRPLYAILFEKQNKTLCESIRVFEKLLSYLVLKEENKLQFPLFERIIEILLAGGLPVGWKGEFRTPLNSSSLKYEIGKGSFIVYWPYEKDPAFSEYECRVIQ